jgi:hypothetical protein
MRKLINDLSGQPTFAAEVDGTLCITSGFDKPRFVRPAAGLSGYLGYQIWADEEYAPLLSGVGTGTLNASKFYSIRLVPFCQYLTHQAQFVTGTPSAPSAAQTGDTSYTFDLTQHPEDISFETGISTAYTTTTVTDSSKSWVADQWNGYTVINRATGETALITATAPTQLTFDTDIFTAIGEDFSILAPKTTGYAVYAVENNTGDLTGASWLLQGYIDYGVTSYTLSTFVSGQIMVEDEYFGPENFKLCVEGKGRLFAGGGITETRGKASAQVPLYDAAGVLLKDGADVTLYAAVGGNQLAGTLSGPDQTYFTEGMAGAYITFEGDVKSYLITAVDTYRQILTLSENYDGIVTTTATSFTITSDYELWYSDVKNPHVFRTGNYVEIPDRIEGLAEQGGYILVFCSTSLYRVNIDTLGQQPVRLPEDISFNAPYSVVKTPKGVIFYDGEGFSSTDGNSVTSITKYRASDYLAGINPEMTHNVRGVYNPNQRRVEYYFAYGTEITNNYGLFITVDSLNCYGTSRVDCNAVWMDREGTEKMRVYHGTSGRHTTNGYGDVWKHDPDLATDGDLQEAAHYFTVTAVDTGTRTVSVKSLAGVTVAISGWSILHVSSLFPTYQQLMIDTLTSTGTDPQTYDITLGDDWDINSIAVGDFMVAGGIPVTFGPVWTDFASPTYQHHVRALQIDSNGFEGILFVDHYLDSKETSPVETDVIYVSPDDTHLRVPFKGGSGVSYGFRIRGYAITKVEINSISRIFDTEA